MRCGNGHQHGSVDEVRMCYGLRPHASATATVLHATRSTTPGPTPGPALERNGEPKVMTTTAFPFPAQLLFGIREGRYAVSTDDSDRMTFIRISIIQPFKNVQRRRAFEGWLKIQTQHGDDLRDRYVISPDGSKYYAYTSWGPRAMVPHLAMIVADPWRAAIAYGRELGQCCRCGKNLTDERSRYYGIGPECETKWGTIIDEVIENYGTFVPSEGI